MRNHTFSILSVQERKKLFACVSLPPLYLHHTLFPDSKIGINYFGQDGELRGCINDAQNIQRFLCSKSHTPIIRIFSHPHSAQFGYKKEDIVMLTDDATNPRMMPTRDNIVRHDVSEPPTISFCSDQRNAMVDSERSSQRLLVLPL